jgi:copper chaperone CopZ
MGKYYPVIEVLDEEEILDCELGPIEKTLGASKKFGKEADGFADREEYCQTFPERCWLTSTDKLIEHQKKMKEYRESDDPKKDITMVFPYKYDLQDDVQKNYCPSCTRHGIGYDPSKVAEAKRKNRERMENEKQLANLGSVSSASSSLDKAKLQNANAQIQEARREMEELKKAMQAQNKNQQQPTTTTTTTTIVTPASDTNIFKKHKVIIIIGISVFLLLLILLLVL